MKKNIMIKELSEDAVDFTKEELKEVRGAVELYMQNNIDIRNAR